MIIKIKAISLNGIIPNKILINNNNNFNNNNNCKLINKLIIWEKKSIRKNFLFIKRIYKQMIIK